MGLFRSTRKLMQQSKQAQQQYPLDQLITNAQQQMAAGLAAMQSMAAAGDGAGGVDAAAAGGVDVVATVVTARQTGMLVNYNPVLDVELMVTMPGGIPVPVSTRQTVAQLDLIRAQPGVRLAAKAVPDNPAAIWIDWSRSL